MSWKDKQLLDVLEGVGVDVVLGVPCSMFSGLIPLLEGSTRIRYIPVTREEEGVGIAAGLYLGGLFPALLMQNSGLGNAVNALKSLTQYYCLPLLLLVSHRGAEGEKIAAQVPMGEVTLPLLECLGIPYHKVWDDDDLTKVPDIAGLCRRESMAVAIVFSREYWGTGS